MSDTQAAPCWLVSTPDGRWAYVVNAASASVSSLRVARSGAQTLVDAVAARTGSGSAPTDATVSTDGTSLALRLGDGTVASYAIGSDGSLTSTGTAIGAAAIGSAGLASS